LPSANTLAHAANSHREGNLGSVIASRQPETATRRKVVIDGYVEC
jgi:hypothetical protein